MGQKQGGKVCRLEVRVLLWHLLMSWFIFTTDTVQIATEPNVLCLLTLLCYLLLYFIPHVLKNHVNRVLSLGVVIFYNSKGRFLAL